MMRWCRVFGALVLASLLSQSVAVWAQGSPLEHAQTKDLNSQVQVQGTSPDPNKSFVETYGPPEDLTSEGSDRIDFLFQYASWIGFFYFCLIAFSLVFFLWAYRERPGHRAHYTRGTSKTQLIFAWVFLAIFFSSVDMVLLYRSMKDSHEFFWNYPKGPDVVRVQVMPQQWVWNFKYPGNDNEFGTADDIDTINELRVPKGKKVMLEIKAKDVIHGFMVQEFRKQVDAIPGTVTKFWFDTTRTGEFEVACMHHCGTSHYKMKAFLTVMEAEDYTAWAKEHSVWAQAKFDPNDKVTHWGWKWGS